MSSSRDLITEKYAAGRQTFIIPLTFPDINDARNVIERVGYGGDIWELRVDLLQDSAGDPSTIAQGENIPSLAFVRAQVSALQDMSDLPILFTIRTKSQGGKFPDSAHDEALALMSMAVDAGIAYIDVEIEWPASLIQQVVTKSKASNITKLVASYHSWTGKVGWTSQELRDRFANADGFGDIVKLSILSTSLEDCFELGLFVRDHARKAQEERVTAKPLLAVGMGSAGQLSRITSPISLVTHPLIPFPSAPGQLSLAEVHRARALMGLLPKKSFYVRGGVYQDKIARALQVGFDELGLPYTCSVMDGTADGELEGHTSCNVENVDPSTEEGFAELGRQFTEWTSRRAPLSVIKECVSS